MKMTTKQIEDYIGKNSKDFFERLKRIVGKINFETVESKEAFEEVYGKQPNGRWSKFIVSNETDLKDTIKQIHEEIFKGILNSGTISLQIVGGFIPFDMMFYCVEDYVPVVVTVHDDIILIEMCFDVDVDCLLLREEK